ncbi:MAG: murein L,D-transpeptidase catalytic domain family protein [Chitinophagales bacterium]
MKKILRIGIFVVLVSILSSLPHTSHLSNLGNANTANSIEAQLVQFEDYAKDTYEKAGLEAKGLDFYVFKSGVTGFYNLMKQGQIMPHKSIVSIIDFRKPSFEKRMYIVDLNQKKLLKQTFVAHGKNTGLIYATNFSNAHNSLQSSLGFYKTDNPYQGDFGYSLRLDGMEVDFNDQARSRAIVLHGADFVGQSFVNRYGRCGRSYGCPAVPLEDTYNIINTIKGGNCLFIYKDDLYYLNESKLLNTYEAASFFAQK